MTYPVDTAVETAIATMEQIFEEPSTAVGRREAVGKWRQIVKFVETLGVTGYDALTQNSDANWDALDLFNGPND
jgi:hypothetical protein